jgi:hypothetical protein
MAMVMARKFDDQIPFSIASRQSKSAHRGFGTRRDEANFLHAWEMGLDPSCNLLLNLGRHPIGCPLSHLPLHDLYDRWMGMTMDESTPRTTKVNKVLPIDIDDLVLKSMRSH